MKERKKFTVWDRYRWKKERKKERNLLFEIDIDERKKFTLWDRYRWKKERNLLFEIDIDERKKEIYCLR